MQGDNSEARELAKKMIAPYVLRGDSLESLMDGQMGQYGSDADVAIHGNVFDENMKLIHEGKRDEIVVSEIAGKHCCYVFKLKTLYNEISSGQLKLV